MIEITLDLICDVRDDLNGMSLILTMALLVEDRPVHLTGGDIASVIQGLVDETLVVTEIEVGLRTIIRDENLTMLNRIHRTRIDVDIRVELLHGNLIAARLQKTAERSRCNPLSESGNDATGDKYVLDHMLPFRDPS